MRCTHFHRNCTNFSITCIFVADSHRFYSPFCLWTHKYTNVMIEVKSKTSPFILVCSKAAIFPFESNTSHIMKHEKITNINGELKNRRRRREATMTKAMTKINQAHWTINETLSTLFIEMLSVVDEPNGKKHKQTKQSNQVIIAYAHTFSDRFETKLDRRDVVLWALYSRAAQVWKFQISSLLLETR